MILNLKVQGISIDIWVSQRNNYSLHYNYRNLIEKRGHFILGQSENISWIIQQPCGALRHKPHSDK